MHACVSRPKNCAMLCLLQKARCLLLSQVLKLLNSNSETPNLIWTNGTRAELLEFLEHQQERIIKRVREGEPPNSTAGHFQRRTPLSYTNQKTASK